VRVAMMEPVDDRPPGHLYCDAACFAWVCSVTRIAVVMEAASTQFTTDAFFCTLSENSLKAMERLDVLDDWPEELKLGWTSENPSMSLTRRAEKRRLAPSRRPKVSASKFKLASLKLKKTLAKQKKKAMQPGTSAVKGSTAALQEISALPENFARSAKGNKLVQQELEKLLILDTKAFPDRPIVNPDGNLRSNLGGLPWRQIVERAPASFSNDYYKIRSRKQYGITVHTRLSTIASQLQRTPPVRTEWLQLLKDIPASTVGVVILPDATAK
jgi:hypothetical protein